MLENENRTSDASPKDYLRILSYTHPLPHGYSCITHQFKWHFNHNSGQKIILYTETWLTKNITRLMYMKVLFWFW